MTHQPGSEYSEKISDSSPPQISFTIKSLIGLSSGYMDHCSTLSSENIKSKQNKHNFIPYHRCSCVLFEVPEDAGSVVRQLS